jgi:DNA topoisomerase-1
VAQVLARLFPDLFNVGFTSEMELELDRIEEGELDWRKVLEDFYVPFQRQLTASAESSADVLKEIVAADAGDCPLCGKPMAVRWNKYGRFLGCTGYPECKHTQSFAGEEKQEPKPTGVMCPSCGSELVERSGRFGPFIACSNYPKCKHTQPMTIPGLKCPQCGEGDIGEKRTRRGKAFWGCTRYPACDWSSWDRPVAGPCPDCGNAFLIEKNTKARGEFLKCPNCKGEFESASVGGAEPAGSTA